MSKRRGKPVKSPTLVVAYLDGRKRLDAVLTLDTATLAEYGAQSTSANRINAVIAALSGTVSVKVYDGTGVEKASGTMGTPWGTNVAGQLIVGALSSFSVTAAGTPDSGWYIRFESGARWIRGSFGLRGSGQEFTWSQSTWAVGHTGRIGTVVMLAPTNSAPGWSGAPSTLSLYAGQSYNFGQHASDPDGDPLTFSLSPLGDGYTLTSAGVLTIGTVSKSVTITASDGVLSTPHVCAVSLPAGGQILWRGHFDNNHFREWHDGRPENVDRPWYWTIPQYGRPAQKPGDQNVSNYYGNGDLLELSNTITRGGTYSARLRVKSDGTTSADYDSGNSARRRTEVSAHGYKMLSFVHNAQPYLSTRWVSISVYIPADWSSAAPQTNDAWGPLVWQQKQIPDKGISPFFSIHAKGSSRNGSSEGWYIDHRWSALAISAIPQGDDSSQKIRSYQYDPTRGGNFLVPTAHYVSGQASRNALANLNKGGWTDFVMQMRYDARTVAQGGSGFWKVWMRAGSGAWVYVLNITADSTAGPDGNTFGIGSDCPPVGGTGVDKNGGYTMQCGMYGGIDAMVGAFPDRIVHIDNVKVGDENVAFSQMTHDGSSMP